MLVVPLAELDVNVPGVMETLVAPEADQLSVLLAPEVMLVGFAVNALIVGTPPVPPVDLFELTVPPQPINPAQANRRTASAYRSCPLRLCLRKLKLLLKKKLRESK
jgi:hypothetical protein